MNPVIFIVNVPKGHADRLMDDLHLIDAVPFLVGSVDMVSMRENRPHGVILPWTNPRDFREARMKLSRASMDSNVAAFMEEQDFGACRDAFRGGASDVLAAPLSERAVPEYVTSILTNGVHVAPGIVPLQEMEKEAIQSALDICRGQVSLTARRLGIGRSTLYRKIDQFGISVPK